MKKVLIALVIGMLVCGVMAITNNGVMSMDLFGLGEIPKLAYIYAGPITICCTNGSVTIEDGVTIDEVSRGFWKTLEETYPGKYCETNSLAPEAFSPNDAISFYLGCHRPNRVVKTMRQSGCLTNVIVQLATSGEICKVMGHSWGPTLRLSLEYDPMFVGCRRCTICGKMQDQQLSDWQ